LTRSEKKELEERNKIYDSPHYLIPEERKRSINYRKNRQVSESVETRRSTARRGIKIAKNGGKSPAWTRSEGKDPKGGLNRKGVASYRRENPGSKLKMAVTTPPSKLKKGSKAANRRKSFCARMSGVKGPMRKPNGKPTRKALALRKWNC
jgi:hypothetical protein